MVEGHLPTRSVFILGSPRSGTSVIFKTLARHPSFAFTSNLTRRFRANFLLVRIAELLGKRHRPVEAGPLWKSFWPRGTVERTEADLTDEHRRVLERIVSGHLRHFRRPVFLNKRPDLSIRIPWLAAGLPDAKFIHVLRDGRAVANSILEQVKRYGRPWGMVGREMWADLLEMSPAAYSGAVWSRVELLVAKRLGELDPRRSITIRYEDFVEKPREILEEIARFADVPWGPEHDGIIPSLDNRNWKWMEMMTKAEQAEMLEMARPGLEHFGYVSPGPGS